MEMSMKYFVKSYMNGVISNNFINNLDIFDFKIKDLDLKK